jgi:hypothetical protein
LTAFSEALRDEKPQFLRDLPIVDDLPRQSIRLDGAVEEDI